MIKIFILILAVLAATHDSFGLKILNIFPTTSQSHNILGEGINRHLLNAGHEVTYITTIIRNNTHPKLRQIDVSKNFEMSSDESMSLSLLQAAHKFKVDHELAMLGIHIVTVWTLSNENVRNLLNDPNEHFDVVLVDFAFNEITYSGLAKIFNAPLIWVSTLEPHWILTSYVDEALHPAYSSDIMSPKTPPFTLWQRLSELATQIKVTFYKETIMHYFDSKLYYNEIAHIIKARGMEPPSPQELRYNASLVISNSHVSFGQAHRLPVNYISAGGFHIEEKVKPLPENIQKIIDNANNGVIYFSMGSLLRTRDLTEDVKESLIKMFGSLKQTVIWKFGEDRSGLPNNVHILKWAPQQSILAHPKCALFITHGGLLSVTESIYHAVPIVGLPVFVDQFTNIDRAVHRGFAKKVNFVMEPSLADDLKKAIDEVLGNPKYKENAKELSFIFHHRPVKPGDEIVHWVEHVVKTKGAPHLRSPALLVPWYQKLYLDLAVIIILLVIGGRYLYKNVIRARFQKRVGQKKKTY